ncbi:MAG: hypothetical protein JXD22_05140 [Sedimentisphaerales bacterium]|nr:hypothetical protein [Sedimentisphaerales bacterium]
MAKNQKKQQVGLIFRSILTFLAVVFAFSLLTGCEQPLEPGMTYHKLSSAWPIFDLEKWEGVEEGGITWKREKGDACCWLATWENNERFDKEGFRIYRKEKSGFFPIYATEVEETEKFINKQGSVLFYPYKSQRIK